MSKHPNRLVLLLLALTLAVAPMRGILAMPAPASDAGDSPCAGMQHDMQHGDARPAMHHEGDPAESGEPCGTGCNGDCCDNACSGCAHPATALLNSSIATAAAHHPPRKNARITRFSDRTVIPLLRPPASL
jgi:hypothetical protein